jgi:hypothetical protein
MHRQRRSCTLDSYRADLSSFPQHFFALTESSRNFGRHFVDRPFKVPLAVRPNRNFQDQLSFTMSSRFVHSLKPKPHAISHSSRNELELSGASAFHSRGSTQCSVKSQAASTSHPHGRRPRCRPEPEQPSIPSFTSARQLLRNGRPRRPCFRYTCRPTLNLDPTPCPYTGRRRRRRLCSAPYQLPRVGAGCSF